MDNGAAVRILLFAHLIATNWRRTTAWSGFGALAVATVATVR